MLELMNVSAAYGRNLVVDDLSLAVQAGERVGLLGPNGAGKSTTVALATGLLRPSAGRVLTLGHDPATLDRHQRQQVGVQLQTPCLPPRSTVGELCDLYGRIYDNPLPAEKLLDRLQLADKADRIATSLSGGEQQRLCLVLALVGRPVLLFLDELSTGLDPEARRTTWDMLRDYCGENGATVILASHVLEEVEALCDRIVFLYQGTVALDDTVSSVLAHHEAVASCYTVPTDELDAALARAPGELDHLAITRDTGRTRIVGPHPGTYDLLARHLSAASIQRRPADLAGALAGYYREGHPREQLS